MAGGYAAQILFVNLSTGKINAETPDESLNRDSIGVYGLGATLCLAPCKAHAGNPSRWWPSAGNAASD